MKTLVESIFDNDQTHVDNSTVEAHNIRTISEFEYWLKDNDLLMSDSKAKQVIKELYPDESKNKLKYIYKGINFADNSSKYHDNAIHLECFINCHRKYDDGHIEDMNVEIVTLKIYNNGVVHMYTPGNFIELSILKEYQRQLEKVLGHDWKKLRSPFGVYEYVGK